MKTIQLTLGRVALVSDEDWERVRKHHWYNRGKGYVAATINHKKVYLHDFIMDVKPGERVDHKNHIRTDCQRENLRKCTQSKNQQNREKGPNTSGYKGVSYIKRDKTFASQICVDGRQIRLGSFQDPVEAAKWYDAAAKAYFKDFAFLNFPEEATC